LKTLILSAGKIDYTRLPFGMHQSNATIPVNGKPVISWILDDLIQKNYTDINIVVREENERLKQLLKKHYGNRVQLDIISLNNPTSILDSLQAGLVNNTSNNESVQVILGDTLIYDSFEEMHDNLFVAQVKTSQNWCVINTNDKGELIELIDKKVLPGDNHVALCGYYQFNSANTLLNCVKECITQGSKELSAVLLKYHTIHPLTLKMANSWFDFGHLESFIQSKKSLLRPRHFNQLTIDPLINTITKVSEKNEKLAEELNWYLKLPDVLKTLTPRIITKEEQQNKKVTITQEFYGYPSLSELFVFGDLSTSVWKSIIDYLFQIHGLFKQYEKPATEAHLVDMYESKTQDRIQQMLVQDHFWDTIWAKELLTINGVVYDNIKACLEKLAPDINALTKQSTFNIIHGDYCLSNILYDLNNQIVRLIDPRGSFGEMGIYGDARYDIAKLRHSLVGLYDYVVGDLFQIKVSENGFDYELFEDDKNKQLALYTDKIILVNGYNLSEIKLIEGLLFLSMIPYHADYKERQYMMYVKSVQILNELINKELK
jgi:dTDP-glucose pyrophosphorylase/aminoglycoside phosphotransferase